MDFLFRIAILALGYVYPAYKCFKFINYGKPKSEQLHVWCQYWIIIALFTWFERVADTFISWLPFYSGAKLAFVVYLWHPDTKGTEYVYHTLLKPLVSKHTESVDFNLGIFRDETVRVLEIFWTRLILQVQSKVTGMLHQSAMESPNVAARPVMDGVPVYPSVPASLYWSSMQQHRRPAYPAHQPLVTQSAIWPDEQHKQQPPSSLQSSIAVPPGKQTRLSQLFNSQTSSILQPDTKVQELGVLKMASGPPSGGREQTDNGADKEEIDFELVHTNEVPVAASSGAATVQKRKISAQGVRSRWWW